MKEIIGFLLQSPELSPEFHAAKSALFQDASENAEAILEDCLLIREQSRKKFLKSFYFSALDRIISPMLSSLNYPNKASIVK